MAANGLHEVVDGDRVSPARPRCSAPQGDPPGVAAADLRQPRRRRSGRGWRTGLLAEMRPSAGARRGLPRPAALGARLRARAPGGRPRPCEGAYLITDAAHGPGMAIADPSCARGRGWRSCCRRSSRRASSGRPGRACRTYAGAGRHGAAILRLLALEREARARPRPDLPRPVARPSPRSPMRVGSGGAFLHRRSPGAA